MCYYHGTKVTRTELVKLESLEKLVARYEFLDTSIFKGPEYPLSPIMKSIPGQQDFELTLREWGFLPPYIQTQDGIAEFRKNYITLNAKVENLFHNDDGKPSLYADAAMKRRCLIPSTHFFDWRHVRQRGKKGQVLKATTAYPYLIRLKEQEIYYFAGIWNPNALRGDTYSIVTTEANLVMGQIHNLKKRMPTILTEDLAWEWLFNERMTERDVQSIGSYQIDSLKMDYYTVDKAFLRNVDPMKRVDYHELPPLGEDVMGTPQLDLF
ncbi:MAG: SOS response-associated peptidase family protein [Chitinophagaceae bacterium]